VHLFGQSLMHVEPATPFDDSLHLSPFALGYTFRRREEPLIVESLVFVL
jgi:hypothetical protein